MEYNHFIVPLDGSSLAETVLPHLELLASACKIKEVDLVRVIHPVESHYRDVVPLTIQEENRITQDAVAEANSYLDHIKTRIKMDTFMVTTTVLQGDAASAIDEFINKSGADLVLIATHGRSGISLFYWGSVAEKIIRSTRIPVLIVHPPS